MIHWEIMLFRNEYIGFQHNIIRHPFIPRPVKSPSNLRKKLHVCVVGVDPIYGDVTVGEEFEELVRIFSSFEKEDKIRLSQLYQEKATLDNIKDTLFKGVDVWHFNGHGFFDDNNPERSSLVVWPESKPKSQKEYDLLSRLSIHALVVKCDRRSCSVR